MYGNISSAQKTGSTEKDVILEVVVEHGQIKGTCKFAGAFVECSQQSLGLVFIFLRTNKVMEWVG